MELHILPPGITIHRAETDEAIARCYPVMLQLRPLLERESFVARVQAQMSEGYKLAFLEKNGVICSVSGYRYLSNLINGRFCYVDDLVTDSAMQSAGFGRLLFDWLVAQAVNAGCMRFVLDSGVQRFPAHRFYLQRRMNIAAHHFTLDFRDSLGN